MNKIQALIVALSMVSGLAVAQDPEDKENSGAMVELSPVVVVGSPIIESTSTDRYAQEKTTVGEEQIENLNAGDPTSALRRTPGVTISRYNMVGSYGGGDGGSVYLRGMGQGRPGAEIGVIFAGAPKGNTMWSHPLMDTVSVDVIDTIDVYKSPQPVFYGNNSFGVLSVHPKMLEEPGSTFEVSGGGGTYGTWFEIVEGGVNDGRLDGYFVQSTRESEGHREHSAGRVETVYARVGYRATDNFWVTFHGISTSSFAEDPGPKDGAVPDRSAFIVDNTTGVLTLENQFDWGEGYVKGYVDRGYINWRQEDKDTNTPWQNYGLRVRQSFRFEGLEVVGGVDGSFMGAETIEDNLFIPNKRAEWDLWHLWEPWVAASYQLGDRDGFYVTPSYGYRWHQHSEFENHDGWQAGVVAGYNDLEFHYNRARAYNYPGQFVRFFYEESWSMFYEGDEYKDLKVEYVDHQEAGVSLKLREVARLRLTWFEDKGDDRYVWIFPPPPPPRIVNLGEFELWGYEASAVISPVPEANLYFGYTRIFVEEPEKLPRAPEATFTAGLNMLLAEVVSINVDYAYVSDQYVGDPRFPENFPEIDGYELVNAKVAWLFTAENMSGEVWAAGENLGNADIEYLPDYPMPGQTWMGGVSIRF